MIFRELVPGLWAATRSSINLFALRGGGGVVLIDAGYPHFVPDILSASKPLGPIANVVVTHAHPDHAGGLRGLLGHTGATAWMHPKDAGLVREGCSLRPYTPSPTLMGRLATRLLIDRRDSSVPAVENTQPVRDGDCIPVAGGLMVYHLPGHSAGQIALGWNARDGQHVIFAADVCMNVVGLSEPLLYEDRPLGVQSIGRLADIAQGADLMVVGHGQPLRDPGRHLSRLAEGLSRRKGHQNI